jgi:branched-chain amino acid transport system substrate-binding protein
MKKIWIVFSIILVLALAIVLFVNQTKKEPKEVKIGAILPLTGPAAMYGQYAKEGIQLAIEELHSKGKKIGVIFEDSKGAPADAVTIAQKFISTKDIPVILCLTTSETSAIAPVLEKNKVVLITGTINPGAADLGEYIFRNASNLILDAEKIIKLLLKLNIKRVAIIGLTVDAHLKVEEFFKRDFEERGGKVVAIENGNRDDTDFRTQLTKLKNANPEAIYVLGYKEIGYVLRQAKEMGIKAKFFSDPSMESPEILTIAGEAAEGVIYTRAAFDPQSPDAAIQKFRKKYLENYGREPEVFAAQFYDDVRLIAMVSEKYGTTSDGIRKGLLGVKNYLGMSGLTTFLPNGDVEKSVILKTVKDGKFIRYE